MHPMQGIYIAPDGVVRFRQNQIVRFLLDNSRHNLNELTLMGFSDEDWIQFHQLTGYSVSGYGDLSVVPQAVRDAADHRAARVWSDHVRTTALPDPSSGASSPATRGD